MAQFRNIPETATELASSILQRLRAVQLAHNDGRMYHQIVFVPDDSRKVCVLWAVPKNHHGGWLVEQHRSRGIRLAHVVPHQSIRLDQIEWESTSV